MKRTANAIWLGTLKNGAGNVSAQSKAINKTPYSFFSRHKNQSGTNPEELLAAAHAACFTMQISEDLTKFGFIPEIINTEAAITFEREGISKSSLKLYAKVPRISQDEFFKIANKSKEACSVSKILNIEVTLESELDQSNWISKIIPNNN